MAETFLPIYGTANQTFTCTFTSLANAAAQCALAVNFGGMSVPPEDVLIALKIKTGASGVSASGTVNVYAYGSIDGGATYSDGAPGTNSGFTLTVPTNLRLIGVINAVADATEYYGGPFSLAAAFGGVIPAYAGIVIENQTGAALDASVGSAAYQAINGGSTP